MNGEAMEATVERVRSSPSILWRWGQRPLIDLILYLLRRIEALGQGAEERDRRIETLERTLAQYQGRVLAPDLPEFLLDDKPQLCNPRWGGGAFPPEKNTQILLEPSNT